MLNKTHSKAQYQTSSGLPITTWLPHKSDDSKTIRIYIEGDGRAWVRKNRVSSDPTPNNRLVHALMLEDRKINTAYIGRPCQYHKNNVCKPNIWTFSRYNNEPVQAINEIVDKIKASGPYQQIELVGFSGGATIALLISSWRNDITSVRTIAGNLDPVYTNNLHKVSPMPNALNPSAETQRLQYIPQWHFIGANDPIIKKSVFTHYLSAFKNQRCIKSSIIENASHNSGWIERWPELLEQQPSCN